MAEPNSTPARKQAAVDFLKMATSGKVDEAYRRYVDMGGKHHNAYYPSDFESLKQGMKENDAQFPEKRIEVKHVLGDGDLVAVHSRIVLQPGGQGVAVVHLFRFEGERIVEMWDVGQAAPEESPNREGMF